jgi:hypothetical protein
MQLDKFGTTGRDTRAEEGRARTRGVGTCWRVEQEGEEDEEECVIVLGAIPTLTLCWNCKMASEDGAVEPSLFRRNFARRKRQ